jgi:glutamine synthetase
MRMQETPYLELKRADWPEFKQIVTDWEKMRYMDLHL